MLHYVDDSFITNSTKQGCAADLTGVKHAMQDLGTPDAPDKTKGPETRITFLGIQIGSQQMTVSLDQARLDSLRFLLREWDDRHTCSLRQLQSTIGTLSWASQVVRHGRTFVQHMRDLLTSHHNCPRPDDTAVVPVTPDMRDDLQCGRTT